MSHVKGTYHPERCKKLWPHRDAIRKMALSGVGSKRIGEAFGSDRTTANKFIREMGWRVNKSPKERFAEGEHVMFNGIAYSLRKGSWGRASGNHRSLARDLWDFRHPDDPVLKGEAVVVTEGNIRDTANVELRKVTIAELCKQTFYPDDDEFKRMYNKAVSLANITLLHERSRDPEVRRAKSDAMKRMWAERHDELAEKVRSANAKKLADNPDYFREIGTKAHATRKAKAEADPDYYRRITEKRLATMAKRRNDG